MLVALLCLLSNLALAEENDPFQTLSTRYATSQLNLRNHYLDRSQNLNLDYAAALEKMLTQAQMNGEIDRLDALLEEQQRYNRTGKPIDPMDRSILVDLHLLQKEFHEKSEVLEQSLARAVLTLASRYQRMLEQMKTDLTRSVRLDEAVEVKEELEIDAQAELEMRMLGVNLQSSAQEVHEAQQATRPTRRRFV